MCRQPSVISEQVEAGALFEGGYETRRRDLLAERKKESIVEAPADAPVCCWLWLCSKIGNNIMQYTVAQALSFLQSIQNFLLHPDTLRQMTPEQTAAVGLKVKRRHLYASDDDEVNFFLVVMNIYSVCKVFTHLHTKKHNEGKLIAQHYV